MNRRCRPLLCGVGVAVDVARPDGPLAWASRLLNGREDRADVETLKAQPRINNARKMPSADGELRKSLLCSLLGRKKYGKMYLESLRNGINI